MHDNACYASYSFVLMICYHTPKVVLYFGHQTYVRTLFGKLLITVFQVKQNLYSELANHLTIIFLIVIGSASDLFGFYDIVKCEFAKRQVKFLGHLISEGKIRPNPEKVKAINSIEKPKNAKGVQSFVSTV